jgi:predicted nucleic acid-binding Zn ribbon protein
VSDPNIPLANPVSGIPAHKHCEVCGKAVALDGRVCSPECQAKAIEAFRMRRRSVYIFVGLMAIALLFGLYGTKLIGL